MSIKVVAKLVLKDGVKIEGELNQLIDEMIEKTRAEAGYISYTFCRLSGDERTHAFIEEWESPEILAIHAASEHFTRLIPAISVYAEDRLGVEKYAVLK